MPQPLCGSISTQKRWQFAHTRRSGSICFLPYLSIIRTAPFVFFVFLRVAVRHTSNDTGRTLHTGFLDCNFPGCGQGVQPSTFFCVCRTVHPVFCIVSRILRTPNQRFLSFPLLCAAILPGIYDAPSALSHNPFRFIHCHTCHNARPWIMIVLRFS